MKDLMLIDKCTACGLYKKVKTPKMKFSGEGKTEILILGESSGLNEDIQGKQFVGKAGQLLRRHLVDLGYIPDRDFYFFNCISCRSFEGDKNRNPTIQEMDYCFDKVIETVNYLRPKLIVSLGASPLYTLFNRYLSPSKRKTISEVRGIPLVSKDFNCWILPTFHPSYLQYNADDPEISKIFVRDLKKIRTIRDKEIERRKKVSINFSYSTSKKDCCTFLDKIISGEIQKFSIDWETTGLSPYNGRDKIISVGLSDGKDTVAFFLFEDDLRIKLLEALSLKRDKIAANSSFEDKWSMFLFKEENKKNKSFVIPYTPVNIDTQIKAHILDERPGITSLEFQVASNFGVFYKQDVKRDSLIEENPNDVLKYNAKDAYYEYWLNKFLEEEIIGRGQSKASEAFLIGNVCLSETSMNGIRISPEIKNKKEYLVKDIKEKQQQLYDTKEGKLFSKTYHREVVDSNKDLSELLFNLMKIKPIKMTKKGKPSADEEVLKTLDEQGLDFCKLLLELRKLKKLKSTYIDNLIDFQDENGYIHPDFSLAFVRTYRSSASNPNLQNIPKRSEEGNEIRKLIVPSEGNILFSVDYSGAEVRGIACYSQDEILLKWLNQNIDVHKYWASKLYKKSEDEVKKEERYDAKNGLVFPLFYGSYYVSIAKDLGLKETWIKYIEDQFWSLHLGIKKWQDKMVSTYEKNGYIEMFGGFRRHGPLSRNQIVNSCIQGSSFHILLNGMVRIKEFLKEGNFKSKLIGEIHDELLFDMVPSEAKQIVLGATEILQNPSFKWTKTVPWEVEWAYGPSWGDMRNL